MGTNPELRALAIKWRDQLVSDGIYTSPDLELRESPGRVVSWASAKSEEMGGPLSVLARCGGRVIAGIELWKQLRDRYWFLEMLIRDQDDAYRGSGRRVVNKVIEWFDDLSTGWPLRVHAMVSEEVAVDFWTKYLGRPPDFSDPFIEAGGRRFPAVGWVIRQGK